MSTPKMMAQRLMHQWYVYRMELQLPVSGKGKGIVQSLLDFMHGAHFSLYFEAERVLGPEAHKWDKECDTYKTLTNFTFHRMMISTRGLDWARECASEYARVTAGALPLATVTRGAVTDTPPRKQE